MSRPVFKWLIFAACLAMFLAVMAWITTRTLGMERQRVAAERDAQVQERIRLALWRMDSLASTLLIRENSRPPGDYQAFRSPDELFTRDNREIAKGKALMPSPLLGEPPEFVLLHFEVMPQSASAPLVCSPQVPTGSQLELANNWYAISPQLKYATDRLARLDTLLKKHPEVVSGTHHDAKERSAPDGEMRNEERSPPAPAAPKAVAEVFKAAPASPQAPAPAASPPPTAMDVQIASNVREQTQRSNFVKQQLESEKLNASKVLRKSGEGTLQLYGDSSRSLSDLYAGRSKKAVVGSKDAAGASTTTSDAKVATATPALVANSTISSTAPPVPMEKAKNDAPPASQPMLAAKSLADDLTKSRNTLALAVPAPAAAAPATRSGYVTMNETVKTESKPASPATMVGSSGGAVAPGNGRADAPATLKPAAASPLKPAAQIDRAAGLSRAREADKLAQPEKREERQSAPAKAEPMSLADTNTYTGATVIGGGTLQISGGVSGAATSPPAEPTTTPGDLKPLWLEQELLLVRNASLDGKPRVQGVWVDWEKLRGQLLGAVTDLLPNASLAPALADVAQLDPSALVTLPVKLTAGAISLPMTNGWSALQRALAIAWICLAIAAVATALVLHRAMLLSERRGAFVSAVTHELRTPLTTFQLYSEMLADDMVPDAAKRREYLRTLCDESTRLTHLVENVLAYSRIERGRTAARVERITVGDLVARIEPRLRRRCEEVDLTLEVSLPSGISARTMEVDAMGVEQILFNLVDNACKYAAPKSGPRTLHLTITADGPRIIFRVRDHGPGISKQQQKRLFQPFEKSATDAAHSAPGVGLGLALCRRLAREMGGDLTLEKSDGGACFALRLPLS